MGERREMGVERVRAVTPPRRPTLGILSLSVIADDLRVRRQGDAFAADGWDVTAFGFGGGASPAPDWPIVDIFASEAGTDAGMAAAAEPAFAARLRANPVLRRVALLARSLACRLAPALAEQAYWRSNPGFASMLNAGSAFRPDVWIANDWSTLPIVRRLSQAQGVPFGYDTHELATEEYAQNWRWRLVRRPIIHAIEAQGVAQAAVVSCVSPGIARRLQELYGLARAPLVLRNIPEASAPDPRPVGERIRVLYHGAVSPGRGLEACIASVALWRPEFDLTIRGPAEADYLAALDHAITQAGVRDRVALAPPVTATDLVEAAAEFDIGLFALPAHSLQNVYALPNKLFEYTAAGLALCVSELPEMARFVREHDLGVVFAQTDPQAIADCVNSFDKARTEAFRAKARVVARTLNAQVESQDMRRALADLVAKGGRAVQLP